MPTSQLWRLRLTGTTRVRSPDLGKDTPESLAPMPLRTGHRRPTGWVPLATLHVRDEALTVRMAVRQRLTRRKEGKLEADHRHARGLGRSPRG